ncbi:MAG: DUF1273 family protein [Clostridia bacterium]|nr:DUF1273 family protein [Clostridia bacterium]
MRRIERRAPFSGGLNCAFTGHRPSKYPFLSDETAPGYARVKGELSGRIDRAIGEGYTHFICGGALGADTLAAELLIEKRRGDRRLTLEIAVPCDGQDKYWNKRDRVKYGAILAAADVVTTISSAYTPFCMLERNRYMVQKCQRLIAVYDGTKGGTYSTVLLALNKGIEVEIIKLYRNYSCLVKY